MWGCDMRSMVERLLARLGAELILKQAGHETRLRGLIQHSRSKSLQNMRKDFSPIGRVPGGQYVYIGPAQPAPAAGDELIFGDKVYILRRAERVWFRNTPIYSWGLCVEKGGEPG